MFLVGNVEFLDETVKSELINKACEYDDNDFITFCDEVGWDSWMNDFCETEEGSELTEVENNRINKVLEGIWKLSREHKIEQSNYKDIIER